MHIILTVKHLHKAARARTMKNENVVWLNEKDRIASFHYVAGYQKQEFYRREIFISYLKSLQECGYRFQ